MDGLHGRRSAMKDSSLLLRLVPPALLLLHLFVVVLIPTSCPAAVPAPADKATLTVATFNINFGNPDLPAVVAAIRKSGADIVALQETNAASERFLRRQLAKEYPFMQFRPPKGEYLASGFGFLSRFPLEDRKFLEPKHGLFGTCICRVRVGGQAIQIVSVHLSPLGALREVGLAAALGKLAEVEAVHKKEILRILEGVDAAGPALILGDFNSLSTFVAPRILLEKGFSDSFAAVTKEPEGHPTWRWKVAGKEMAYRLDYIFHRGGLTTRESRVVPTEASDHSLLVSRISLEPEPKAAK
jgi:endonuclease/exonuclease/phosphatase (EEP) superfamily protein YafD